MQTVKLCGGSVRVWGRFATSGPRQLVINSILYKNIFKEDSSSFPKFKSTYAAEQKLETHQEI